MGLPMMRGTKARYIVRRVGAALSESMNVVNLTIGGAAGRNEIDVGTSGHLTSKVSTHLGNGDDERVSIVDTRGGGSHLWLFRTNSQRHLVTKMQLRQA